MRRLLLAAALAILPVLGAHAQDGQRAHDAGRFAEARRLWAPQAEAGDPQAQFGLAVLLDSGRGGPMDRDAARSLFRRVSAHLGGMTPERVVDRGVLGLHRLGLTRQKASYCHALALAVMNGTLSLSRIAGSDDATGRSTLLELRGIGPWSADIYYLMALRRPDVWPVGDLALAVALHEVKRLRRRPDAERQLSMSSDWRPNISFSSSGSMWS